MKYPYDFFCEQNTILGTLVVLVNEIKLQHDCVRVAFKGTFSCFPFIFVAEDIWTFERQKMDLKEFRET